MKFRLPLAASWLTLLPMTSGSASQAQAPKPHYVVTDRLAKTGPPLSSGKTRS